MADCKCLPTCIFFNDQMADMPTTAQSMKRRFCQGNNEECARFMVFSKLGKANVPGDLFPSNKSRAEKILAAA